MHLNSERSSFSCGSSQFFCKRSHISTTMPSTRMFCAFLAVFFCCILSVSTASAVVLNGKDLNKSYKITMPKPGTATETTAVSPSSSQKNLTTKQNSESTPEKNVKTTAAAQPAVKKIEGADIKQPVHYTTGKSAPIGTKAPNHSLDFHDCVLLALQQSPYFVDSALEIKLRHINESDSFYDLFPDVVVSTGYVLTTPYSDSGRWSLNFSTGSYDPVSAGFSIKATKLVTDIAILGHMKSISEGLYKLGQMLIQLNVLEKMAACQDELVAVENHEKNYLNNLLASGASNPLEIRIADQKLEIARLERDRIEAEHIQVMDNLKTFLGIAVSEPLKLDLENLKEQLLGHFSAANVTIADVKTNSLDLQIQKQMEVIRQYDVKLAWARFLPKFNMDVRTVDPIDSDNDGTSGMYTSLGFTWTVWDWGERWRNVDRKRANVKQAEVKTNLISLKLGTDWRQDMAMQHRSLAALKVANAQVELAGLKKRQSEISYQAGSQPFPAYLQQIREYFNARKEALYKESEYVQSELDLRNLSGNLYKSYIDAKSF